MKPLLILGVDGVINAIGAHAHARDRRLDGYEQHWGYPNRDTWYQPWARHPLPWSERRLLFVNPGHGRQLLDLPVDLAWCSRWMENANEWISPLAGLPELPWVPRGTELGVRARGCGASPKFGDVLQYAGWTGNSFGRPFAWVDYAFSSGDWELCDRIPASGLPARALLIETNPQYGLQPEHFERLAVWAANLESEATDA